MQIFVPMSFGRADVVTDAVVHGVTTLKVIRES